MLLSVVITVVEGGSAVDRCLAALEAQVHPPELEIIVPWDDTVSGVPELMRLFPRCRFVAMGHVVTEAPADHARGQHELFDRRRAAGLASASGDIVAILEDRGIPTSDWAQTVARLHRELPYAVIGGSVENGVDRLANRAVYLCDFSRYQRPFEAGPAAWVTDVNVTYKRSALDATRELWKHRYHEPVVHNALTARGETLYLTPALVVFQHRTQTAPARLLSERLHWGRLFAYTRVHQSDWIRRLLYLFATPLIPVIMFVRIARQQAAKKHLRSFLPVFPAVFLLLVVWASGEAVGYATARP